MFKLDAAFLEEIGLGSMPENQKIVFLEHMQDELEVRIGEKMSEGLSDEQIDEFEKVIDGDEATVQKIVASLGDYKNSEVYAKLLAAGYQDGTPEILAELASIQWLAKNRPDYQDIVTKTAEELKAEISQDKEAILGSF